MARTIQSPGVEINEVDLTLRADTNVGTNVFITGFANQGPIDEVLQPTTMSEFEEIFGLPTNSAENYFYHTAKSILNSSPARLLVSRLPYGEERGEGFSNWRYSALAYPVSPVDTWSYQTSSYQFQSVFVSNSGYGYGRIPTILTDDIDSFLTTYEVITANDGLGNNTFGISAIKITRNDFDFSVPPSIKDFRNSYILTNLVVQNSGWGYNTYTPTVELEYDDPAMAYTRSADITVEMGRSSIDLFQVNGSTILPSQSGSGYLVAPTVVVIGEAAVRDAVFIANMAPDGRGAFGVQSLTLVDAGLGYTSIPSLSFSNPVTTYGVKPIGTIDGSFTATLGVTSVRINDAGAGYTEIPTIVITDDTSGVAAEINFEVEDGTFTASPVGIQSFEDLHGDLDVGDDRVKNSLKYIDGVDYNNTGFTSEFLGKSYYIGVPTRIELSAEEYENLKNGNINWTNNPPLSSELLNYNNLGKSAFILLNKSQTSLNNHFEGHYIGLMDNSNYNTSTLYTGILDVKGVQSSDTINKHYIDIPKSRLNFALSADSFGGGNSVSEIMENLTDFDLSDKSFNDILSLGVFKIKKDNNIASEEAISLNFTLKEKYVGTLIYDRELPNKSGGLPQNISLEEISRNSSDLLLLVNPNISNKYNYYSTSLHPIPKVRILTNQLFNNVKSQGFNDTPNTYTNRVGATSATIEGLINDKEFGTADSLYPLGVYTTYSMEQYGKNIGNLPRKLERSLELVENSDVYPIDLLPEAGLGTIFVNAIEQSDNQNIARDFTDSVSLKALSSLYITNYDNLNSKGLEIRNNYMSVANVLINAAEKQRKDFLVILDPIRNIFVQGDNNKIINSKKIWSPNIDLNVDGYVTSNFSQHIYWPLRHQFATINCSYATTYANWAQVSDSVTGRQIWIPFSGIAASIMSNTDANFQPWYAPAGFTRGVVTGVNDLGVYAKQKQRDQLYKISLNPVAFFPNEGFTVFGQKTLLKKPSAFDRINVRRLFLALEKATKNTAKFFVFEPNTLFTRTQVINVLSPIFENAKNTEGLYDYRIVCSELNNTPEVIDNNELKIDIYIQPVRTAEFILVNFYATRTGTNFDELIGA